MSHKSGKEKRIVGPRHTYLAFANVLRAGAGDWAGPHISHGGGTMGEGESAVGVETGGG